MLNNKKNIKYPKIELDSLKQEYNDELSRERIKLLQQMEREFDKRNPDLFKELLTHPDTVIRTRAVCILADLDGEDAVGPISTVLEKDSDELVRHEAAFSLGQLGFQSGLDALKNAVENDSSFFVRHEAAVAIGVIGSENGRDVLIRSLNDTSEEVRKSAIIALANLDYIKEVKRNNKFTTMTGG